MKEKKKNVKKVCLIFFNIILDILLILICIGIFYSYQIKVKKENHANIFGYTFFEVATGSMEPTIKVR